MRDFLRRFQFDDGLMQLNIGGVSKQFTTYVDVIPEELPKDKDIYFGPAMRSQKGSTKADVLGASSLWVDADDPHTPQSTLPPSALVFSGHGWHLYWFLKSPLRDVEEIERVNKLLAEDVPTGDSAAWNANRILRVPGTTNNKDANEPVGVELRMISGLLYNLSDFSILDSLDKRTRHKIRTGDSRGYRSRSERDWAILSALVASGASDELIELIFHHQPCGDKARESNELYLSHSLARVRKKVGKAGEVIFEKDDGYYIQQKQGLKKVSTFTIVPEILLDGTSFSEEDAIVGKVRASGFTWDDVTFPRSAFTTTTRLDKSCPVAAWQWLGHDSDVRQLLPHLLSQLQERGLPKVSATSTLGLHFIKGLPYFLGDKRVLGPDIAWNGYEGPIAWLPSGREHPEMDLSVLPVTDGQMRALSDQVFDLNEVEAIYPMLGWYSACMFKPWLEDNGYRFPALNVVGTRGAGKTTLIQRVFMPLFGQSDPKSYDAGTTRFVTLALLGSTNAVPIAFSEFRYDAVQRFIRFILLAYDTGHDPRGRGDQTTVDYPLSAPFSVDGEDLIEDPAARERIVVVHLHPDSIAEGSLSYNAYNALRGNFPTWFGGNYIQAGLQMIRSGRLKELLVRAREEMFEAFPMRLPDRVRANHTVAHFGATVWSEVTGAGIADPLRLKRSIQTIYNVDTGRSRTMADALVEDVVNACSQGTNSYRWSASQDGTILFFQLGSAHAWWLTSRRRQGRGGLERDALRTQLKEAEYITGPQVVDRTWMYGVQLQQAQDLGLDIPSEVFKRQFKMNF